jgi:hypothetical protein
MNPTMNWTEMTTVDLAQYLDDHASYLSNLKAAAPFEVAAARLRKLEKVREHYANRDHWFCGRNYRSYGHTCSIGDHGGCRYSVLQEIGKEMENGWAVAEAAGKEGA